MSARNGSGPTAAPQRRGRTRRLVVAGLLALVVVAGAVAFLVIRPDSPAATAAPAAPTTAAPASTPPAGTYGTSVLDPSSGAAPSGVPATVLADVPGKPQTLPPVALDQPTDFGDGVSARLVDIKAVSGEARGVGETSGPALAVIVELTNTSADAVSLDTVAVNMYLGADGLHAARLQSASGLPFGGSLAPGASAQAVYGFTVPLDQRDQVTVTVGRTTDSGTAVFSGPVS